MVHHRLKKAPDNDGQSEQKPLVQQETADANHGVTWNGGSEFTIERDYPQRERSPFESKKYF